MNNSKYQVTFAAIFTLILSYLSVPIVDYAQADNIILWNKLGSEFEVTHSELGANGNILGSRFAFEPAQFGKGYIRKATGENYLVFQSSSIDSITSKGTIALWITPKVTQPLPYNYGIFGLVGAPYAWAFLPNDPGHKINLSWGDGVTGLGIQGGLFFNGSSVSTPSEPVQFVAEIGVAFHVAMSWDINGIEGTTDTIHVYRNGQIIGSTTEAWSADGPEHHNIILGYGPDSGGYDKFITDNIVIWDYAKTDFSDRFEENPGVSCDGLPTDLSALINQKTGSQGARLWSLSLNNKSHCPTENAQIDVLSLTQTYGPACTPVVTGFESCPLGLGNILAKSTASGTVIIDFTGCSNFTRFDATITYSANKGAISGSKTLHNQFR